MIKEISAGHKVWLLLLLVPALSLPIVAGSLLRPISDDYCYVASVSQSGVLGFTVEQSTGWSGALLTNTFAALFGWIQQISFQHAYVALLLLTFSLTFLAFSLFTLNCLHKGRKGRFSTSIASGILLGLTFLVSNFGIPVRPDSYEFPYGYTTLGWGAAILSQFLPNLVLLITAGLLIFRTAKTASWISPFILILSAALPLLSIQVGVAWILFSLAYVFRSAQREDRPRPSSFAPATIGFVFTLLNVLSPGSLNRRSVITDVGSGDALSGLLRSIAFSLDSFFSALFVVGLVSGVGVAVLFAKSPRINPPHVQMYLLLSVSVLVSVVATDTFGAYEPWHQTGWRLSVFLVAVLLGTVVVRIWATRNRPLMDGKIKPIVVTSIWILWITFLSVQTVLIASFLNQRAANAASGGPNPVAWIADIEIDWIRNCAVRNSSEAVKQE